MKITFPEEVKIIFDSDTGAKQQCGEAEAALARALKLERADVKIIQLPAGHKGLDDWFVAWGPDWRQQLRKLWVRARRYRPHEDLSHVYSQVYTFNEMLNNDFPIPRFFIGDKDFGIVAEGMVSFVHGSSNIGKTFLATQMAVSVCIGCDFLGLQAGPAGTSVLYLQGELPPGLYAYGRLRPIERYLRKKGWSAPANLKFLNWTFDFAASSKYKEAFTADSWQGLEDLDILLDTVKPQVLVIDALQNYNNLVEASNDQNRELLKRLKERAIRRSIGIILVDHDKKGEIGVEALRGASNKVDLADTVLGLYEDDGLWMGFDKVRYIQKPKPEPWRLVRPQYHPDHTNSWEWSPFFEVGE